MFLHGVGAGYVRLTLDQLTRNSLLLVHLSVCLISCPSTRAHKHVLSIVSCIIIIIIISLTVVLKSVWIGRFTFFRFKLVSTKNGYTSVDYSVVALISPKRKTNYSKAKNSDVKPDCTLCCKSLWNPLCHKCGCQGGGQRLQDPSTSLSP